MTHCGSNLTGPTTASSSGKEWGHAGLLTNCMGRFLLKESSESTGNRTKPGTLQKRSQRTQDKMDGFSSLVCLVRNTALTAYPEMKAVLVISPTPTTWNSNTVWAHTLLGKWEQTCTCQNPNREFTINTLIFSSESARIVTFQKWQLNGWFLD